MVVEFFKVVGAEAVVVVVVEDVDVDTESACFIFLSAGAPHCGASSVPGVDI